MSDWIAEAFGVWFEGSRSQLRRMQGQPVILPFNVVGDTRQLDLLFVEDYFNSLTRIRRGRLFKKDDRNGWPAYGVSCFPNRDLSNPENRFDVNRAYKTADLQIKPNDEIKLGNNGSTSHWIVVHAEKVGLDAHYVTLKSKTYFGVLPEVQWDLIPEPNRQDIRGALDAVVEAASIQAPQSVIDACRNAACHLISAQWPDSNPDGDKELGKLVRWLNEKDKRACGSAGELINNLHSRAKPNAKAMLGTRAVSRQDAELAVSALAFLLQDFRWAVNE